MNENIGNAFSLAILGIHQARSEAALHRHLITVLPQIMPKASSHTLAYYYSVLCSDDSRSGLRPTPAMEPIQAQALALLKQHIQKQKVRSICRPRAPYPFRRLRANPRWRLTPRELLVLERIVHGETNAQIGVRLAISPRTVGKHTERILAKIGAENRTGAAMALLDASRDNGHLYKPKQP